MENQNLYERGSEWRQWDLHIHTPASFHWSGKRFDEDTDSEGNRALVDEMINALNAAEPTVFALMDYWTFEGWFALKRRLQEPNAPKLLKTVFPGIELRLMAPMPGRLNAHVLFSDKVDDQVLRDFQSALIVEIINRPLSEASLIQLARSIGDDKLKYHGFKKAAVDEDAKIALQAGSTVAEINCESYKAAIENVPDGQAVGFMPFDTSDGLADVKWQENYAYFLKLFKTSPIFESRNSDLRDCFVGEITERNAHFIANFQKGLGNVPRLVVSGSDAHCFVGVKGSGDKRGYGDFPSGKATWIKADPTFLGLLQAIMEPAKRSFIGERPAKQVELAENKTYFIDRISVSKTSGTTISGGWLDGTALALNPDLVAIIGNKGSGKSALADVIALLGNSRQKAHFSFLKKDRFRGKTGEPAKHFAGTLSWLDSKTEVRNLNEDGPEDKVELVRYIPQGHFEDLCNAHVAGRSNAFENELRSVIFSHAGDTIRLGALDFEQLIEQQERGFRQQLNEYRKDLHQVNQEVAGFEQQLAPEVRNVIKELLTQKLRQFDEHEKLKPDVIPKPEAELLPEQQEAAASLEIISARIKEIDEVAVLSTARAATLAGKLKAIKNVLERMRLLERSYAQFVEDTAKDLATIGLKLDEVAVLKCDPQPLEVLTTVVSDEQVTLKTVTEGVGQEKLSLLDGQTALKEKLNAPQLVYQKNLAAIAEWEQRRSEMIGTPDAPDTLKGLEERLAQLDKVPGYLENHRARRIELTAEVFAILDAQRKAREQLFRPVQELIQGNSLIRDEYKLQFQATLGGSADTLAAGLFVLIKQNAGEFRGEDESLGVVRKLAEQYDFGKREDVMEFVTKLHDKIAIAAGGAKGAFGIGNLLRKDKTATDVYDLLFDLSFLTPRYSLLFQDAQIEQLSPGQRGALLLIFYLLVDKGRNPIILDQPEENLDNETVVSLLVPVLTEAKKRRQIIMVTHNPNLAVVCDAEQVIFSAFDRKNGSQISYLAGSIENPAINRHVVNVLEGTMPAFNNRSRKYH